jgi:hypothetical protein
MIGRSRLVGASRYGIIKWPFPIGSTQDNVWFDTARAISRLSRVTTAPTYPKGEPMSRSSGECPFQVIQPLLDTQYQSNVLHY